MTETPHYRIVRDKTPEIIKQNGDVPHIRILDNEEYRVALLEELVEKARELLESGGNIDERADVAEVLAAIDELLEIDPVILETVRRVKLRERGGFKLGVYLETTTSTEN
jgi:predicted house-cleaning noncanonical NTP pyrophosphatase (MazG superfamily)